MMKGGSPVPLKFKKKQQRHGKNANKVEIDPEKIKSLARLNKQKREAGLVSYPDEKPAPRLPENQKAKLLKQTTSKRGTKKLDMSSHSTTIKRDETTGLVVKNGFAVVRHGQAKLA
jgi:hypothetical protein